MVWWPSKSDLGHCAVARMRGLVVRNRFSNCLRGVVVGYRFFNCVRGLVVRNRFSLCHQIVLSIYIKLHVTALVC